MGNPAQVQGSRAHRRDVISGDVTPRDLKLEQADALDRRDRDPHHRACDAKVAYYASDEVRYPRFEFAPIQTPFEELFDRIERLMASADYFSHPSIDPHLFHLEEIEDLGGVSLLCSSFQALERIATGLFGPALAWRAQLLLDYPKPWSVVALLGRYQF